MTDPTNGSSKRLSLRKYPNRRYYDTSRSRYVTLEEIYALIRDGYEIQVTDSKTGRDITAKVLAQIILELDPPKLDIFPVALLHRLIRANEQLVNDFVDRYFNQALSLFLDSQKAVEHSVRQAMGLGERPKSPPDWLGSVWGSMPQFWPQGRPRPAESSTGREPSPGPAARAAEESPAAAAAGPVPASDADGLRESVLELRRQWEALRARLAEESGESSEPTRPRKKSRPSAKKRTSAR